MFPTVALQGGPAHEEMLFIITHQVSAVSASGHRGRGFADPCQPSRQAYELWFKQILHEIQSIQKIFRPAVVSLVTPLWYRQHRRTASLATDPKPHDPMRK